jgi:excisionase family DNA binding protein
MINNPFEEISQRLAAIEQLLSVQPKPPEQREAEEYITEEELCKRFNITRPTARKWSREKKIKVLRFGTSKRYRWSEVLHKLDR